MVFCLGLKNYLGYWHRVLYILDSVTTVFKGSVVNFFGLDLVLLLSDWFLVKVNFLLANAVRRGLNLNIWSDVGHSEWLREIINPLLGLWLKG
ncbi:MAG: hypothetical protein AMR96_01725 [Candidatus Adiutrix intracellularis]|nr:MAG: hypothetical protein AMR96_01725 [Candidatus Adiutrix intracellularis]